MATNYNWSVKLPLDAIPVGKMVSFSVTAQSSTMQYFQIIDQYGTPISFEPPEGGTAVPFPINGVGPDAIIYGAGTFQMQEGLQAQIGNGGTGGASAATMSCATTYAVQSGSTFVTKGGGLFLAGEDHGDTDFNDTVVALNWYQTTG